MKRKEIVVLTMVLKTNAPLEALIAKPWRIQVNYAQTDVLHVEADIIEHRRLKRPGLYRQKARRKA